MDKPDGQEVRDCCIPRSALPQGSSRGIVPHSNAQGKAKGPFLRENLSQGLAKKHFVPYIGGEKAVQLYRLWDQEWELGGCASGLVAGDQEALRVSSKNVRKEAALSWNRKGAASPLPFSGNMGWSKEQHQQLQK